MANQMHKNREEWEIMTGRDVGGIAPTSGEATPANERQTKKNEQQNRSRWRTVIEMAKFRSDTVQNDSTRDIHFSNAKPVTGKSKIQFAELQNAFGKV
jgi:hypothetical protein